jgi:hypothetical protein
VEEGVREFWYVKARNITTGEEVQRLAELADEMFGSSAATAEMKTYPIGAWAGQAGLLRLGDRGSAASGSATGGRGQQSI